LLRERSAKDSEAASRAGKWTARNANRPLSIVASFPGIVASSCALFGQRLILWFFQNPVADNSACWWIVALVQSYFAYRVYRYSGSPISPGIVREFYPARLAKLILTAALFVLVWVGVKPLRRRSIAGYLAVLGVGAQWPLIVQNDFKSISQGKYGKALQLNISSTNLQNLTYGKLPAGTSGYTAQSSRNQPWTLAQ